MAGGSFIPVEHPPGTVDIEDVAAANYALEQAGRGKLEPLIERLRSAKALLPEERALAADIIAGRWKRPKHRIAEHPETLRVRKAYLALCVLERRVKGLPHKRAVHEVIKETGSSDSAIRKAVRAHEAMFGSLLRNRRRSGK
jgi:hypothetical protein